MADSILREGYNCWKVVDASRVKFLVDGAAYFAALAEVFEQARESILIVGWDFDSRIHLKWDERTKRPSPDLGTTLNSLAARRPDLHVHILVWDFAMIFALERETPPFLAPVGGAIRGFTFIWTESSDRRFTPFEDHRRRRRRRLCRRSRSCARTLGHAGASSRRSQASRTRWSIFPPHHDVQVAVEGGIAAALGELARERWRRATGERLRAPTANAFHWPNSLAPDLTDVEVGIARTEPKHAGQNAVAEIEKLFVDAIAAARTLDLHRESIPEQRCDRRRACAALEPSGWSGSCFGDLASQPGLVKSAAMDVLRARLVKRLCAVDIHRRLRVYTPVVEGGIKDFMSVHAKLMVVDNQFVRVGSANISNRSMGFDSECDLAIESHGQEKDRASNRCL